MLETLCFKTGKKMYEILRGVARIYRMLDLHDICQKLDFFKHINDI